jgi:DNA repair ATPase RecN
MRPQEKASELFNSMKGFRVKHSHSLKCAIKAVDEMLKEIKGIEFNYDIDVQNLIDYWDEVNTELENLKKSSK